MTKFHKIRETVEDCLDRSEKYLNEKEFNRDSKILDRISWGIGLADAYKHILEKIRQIESQDHMVEDENQ